jgi:ABC-type transport system substrate-binding protein
VQDYLDLNEMYPYDPEKARALLKEAGHNANNPVEFELVTNTDAPFFADAATLLKSQMEKIGVKVRIMMMDVLPWRTRISYALSHLHHLHRATRQSGVSRKPDGTRT